jgi:hypothetical protein
MLRFTIILASCFMMGEALSWEPSQNVGQDSIFTSSKAPSLGMPPPYHFTFHFKKTKKK